MKKKPYKHHLRGINIFITAMAVISLIPVLAISEANRNLFITTSLFFCILLLFLYFYCFINVSTVFTFFVNTFFMLFPYILLLLFIYFLMPAIIIPGITKQKNRKDLRNKILGIIFCIFIIVSLFKIIPYYYKKGNFEHLNKFRCGLMSVQFTTKLLNLKDISAYGQRILANDKLNVPYLYTIDSFPYADYQSAENFCNSLNARVPNYLEVYNIVFNKFDTFGKKYYWTSDKDGRTPILIEFNNMSYNVVRLKENITPRLYCVAEIADPNIVYEDDYIHRTTPAKKVNIFEKIVTKVKQKPQIEINAGEKDKISVFREYPPRIEKRESSALPINIDNEFKHVNFSVKEVNQETFNNLIYKGYNYSSHDIINPVYETNDLTLNARITKDPNGKAIRLCYFPYLDYGNLNITNEAEIWKQSFCSPSFELINQTPVQKTRYEKDAFCYANGGRLPNIPELTGILKSKGITSINEKYWVDSKVSDSITYTQLPVLVYYKDSRFMNIEAIGNDNMVKANTYCIKTPQFKSQIISNYKSRFNGENGSYYAKQKCPDCLYYEIPDVVLNKNL